LIACSSESSETATVATKSTTTEIKKTPQENKSKTTTYEHREIDLINGYVSGCQFHEPHYKVTFRKVTLHQYIESKKKQVSANPTDTDTDNSQDIIKKNDSQESEMTFGSFRIQSTSAKIKFGQYIQYPKGIIVETDDGSNIQADRAVFWFGDEKNNVPHTLYLEGHVHFSNTKYQISFKSLIYDSNHNGMGWEPRLITKNPKGLLGLGRGTNVQAVIQAQQLIFKPLKIEQLTEIPRKHRKIEVEHGKGHIGETQVFKISSKDIDNDFHNIFAGFKAGKNSRHGLYLKSRINFFDGDISLGGNDGIRTRLLGLENWYEKRGIGHGLDGRYRIQLRNAQAHGTLNFLSIDDKDRDRKSEPYGDRNRYFGRWMHRGTVGNEWDWNWEFSRESDPDVRNQFDRKKARREKPYQNRIYLAHKGPTHRLSLLGQIRAEEFVEEVDYLPRLQLDQLQIPFWEHFIMEGHIQATSARRNEAESRLDGQPKKKRSPRVQRADVYEKFSMPIDIFQTTLVEPYVIGNATSYDKDLAGHTHSIRTQAGAGVILSSRFRDGVYRFLPKIDSRKMLRPTVRKSDLYQIDEIDDRSAKDTIDFDWRFLMRGKRFGQKYDIWNLSTHITGYTNPKRDNEGKHWSQLDTRLEIRPHPQFSAFSVSKFDPWSFKYDEVNMGFVINPDSRVEIGTGSNGREIFTDNLNRPRQGTGNRAEWSFSSELRYIDRESSITIYQLDLLPRDKWKVSYAQEWEHDSGAKAIFHRIKINRDLHDWTLSFDFEWDRQDDSQSASVNLTPHNFGKF